MAYEWAPDRRGHSLASRKHRLHLAEVEPTLGFLPALMALTLSLNTNPLVNRFAEPDDLVDAIARDIASAISS